MVVDLLAVMENMRANHPQHFDMLVRVPTTFHRIHYDRYTHTLTHTHTYTHTHTHAQLSWYETHIHCTNITQPIPAQVKFIQDQCFVWLLLTVQGLSSTYDISDTPCPIEQTRRRKNYASIDT